MYMVLPVHALGKKYVVAAAPNDDGTGGVTPRNCSTPPEQSSSFFAVIAVNDNTHVTIHPSGTTRSGVAGATSGPNSKGSPSTITVTLNRGQVFRIKSYIKSNPGVWEIDMTGSQVESDQPIAVLGGCENAFNGTTTLGIPDMRNLSVQMMLPYEYWASKDYIALPLFDAPGLDPMDNSAGDQFKIVVADKLPSGCSILDSINNFAATSLSVAPYQFPAAAQENVLYGITFSSQCGQKFYVEQYDYRGAGDSPRTGPITAPCQMNVVPLQDFSRSNTWTIPSDPVGQKTFHYINVICRTDQLSKIKVYKNGALLSSMASIGTASGSSPMPGYPQLKGYRFEVPVGSYFTQADSAFVVYQYGMSGADIPDKDLGDFDNDDFFWEYATATGQTFGVNGGYAPKVSVDTICDLHPYWTVHVRDTAAIDNFISDIDILNDPLGIIKKRPGLDSGYVSNNVSLERTNYTVVPGLYTRDSVKVVVNNPLKNAEAWVWVVNGAGNDTLAHLTYFAPSLKFGAVTSNGVDVNGEARLNFTNVQVGVDTCSQFVLKNDGTSGSPVFNVRDVHFQLGGQGFTASAVDINGNKRQLPIKIGPGDSVIVQVCFITTQNGVASLDTLIVATDCPAAIGYVSGSSSLPQISAADVDFGPVLIGRRVSRTVRVSNTGKAAFTLTKDWAMNDFGGHNFKFVDSLFPHMLPPMGYVDLWISYMPTNDVYSDSTILIWGTNISDGIKTDKKNYSILKGHGIQPSLEWEPVNLYYNTPCDSSQTQRIYLMAEGTAKSVIDSIRILGPTRSEFKIAAIQGGKTDGITIGETLPDSLWVDVTFTPDAAYNCKGLDSLVVYDENKLLPAAYLFGNRTAGVQLRASQLNMTITPNPAKNTLFISLSNVNTVEIELLDVLGSRLIQRHSNDSQIPIDLNPLPAGVYFVRVLSQGGVATKRVVKE